MRQRIFDRIQKGELVRGTHVFCGAPMLTEALGLCGFDAIWIDMEHTAIGKDQVLNNLIAARAGGAASFVRVAWNDFVLTKPIIDMGPDAIIFPYVRTAEEARFAVASCAYPPAGMRGYGPLRALDYGNISQIDYVDNRFRDMLRIIQVEHIDAVNCLEELVALEGIDGFIVGPNDLSGSMGHIGRPNHPDMMPIYDKIGKILKDSGKLFGVSMGFQDEIVAQWLERGINTLFCGTDVEYVNRGASALFTNMNRLSRNL